MALIVNNTINFSPFYYSNSTIYIYTVYFVVICLFFQIMLFLKIYIFCYLNLKSSLESRVQGPRSRVQGRETRVEEIDPGSRVQSPVQVLYYEFYFVHYLISAP